MIDNWPLPEGWKFPRHKLEPPDRLARRQRNKLRKLRIHKRRKHGRNV